MLMERRAQDDGIDLGGVPALPPAGNLDALCR
jgi:hypothetical protein